MALALVTKHNQRRYENQHHVNGLWTAGQLRPAASPYEDTHGELQTDNPDNRLLFRPMSLTRMLRAQVGDAETVFSKRAGLR